MKDYTCYNSANAMINDQTCFILHSEKSPLPVPAPVMSPDGQHYLSFETLYGKVDTAEKDYPFLEVKSDKKKAMAAKDHKFPSQRVNGALECFFVENHDAYLV